MSHKLTLATDPAVATVQEWTWFPKLPQTDMVRYGAGIAGALAVLAIGRLLAARSSAAKVDTAAH